MALISLNHFNVSFTPLFEPPSLVFVAGGRAPGSSWLRDLCREKDVWAVDRGLDHCMVAGIKPSFFIGDSDSVSERALRWSREENIPSLLFPPEKDLTDLQLAFKEACGTYGVSPGRNRRAAILTGAFGGRFDHLFANLFSLIWAEEEGGMKVRCVADESEALFSRRRDASTVGPGRRVLSTLALRMPRGKDEGTKWTIREGSLYLNKPCCQ